MHDLIYNVKRGVEMNKKVMKAMTILLLVIMLGVSAISVIAYFM